MKLVSRSLFLSIAIAFPLALPHVCFSSAQVIEDGHAEIGDPQPAPTLAPRLTKDELIDLLAGEETGESLRMLSHVSEYVDPGFRHLPDSIMFSGFPLSPETGAAEIDVSLSNRRVMKLVFELKDLEPSLAAELLSRQLRENLNEYARQIESTILASPSIRDMSPNAGSGIASSTTDRVDGTPTVIGLRYSIFACLILASTLELTEAKPAVLDVVEYALQQREEIQLEAGKSVNAMNAVSFMTTFSLFNRQILLQAIARTCNLSHEARTANISTLSAEFTNSNQLILRREIPPFIVETTPWDVRKPTTTRSTHEPAIPTIPYEGYQFVTDEAVLATYAIARQAQR